MQSFLKLSFLALVSFTLISCNGSSSSSSKDDGKTPVIKTTQGTVYDDVIVNLPYKTKGFNSKTDENGKFNYKEGKVEFFLGKVKIGEISKMPTDKKVFLSDMLNLPRGTYKNDELIKLARTLQSLDTTKGDEKIILDEKTLDETFDETKTLEEITIDEINTTLNDQNITLIDEESATKEVKDTYEKEDVKPIEKTITPPIANAGINKAVKQGTSVTLDGGASTDSDGNITKYEWFEDGKSLHVGKTFTKTFDLGVHTITLKVTDNDGATNTDEVTITVTKEEPTNQPPTANPKATPTNATQGTIISFDGSTSTDSDGTITKYEWLEGAKSLHVGKTFTKDDFTLGSHTITLKVTDNNGATDKKEVTIQIADKPTAKITGITTPTNKNLTLQGDTSTSDSITSISNYEWFVDGVSEQNGTSSTYTTNFTASKDYTITLKVTDALGGTNQTSKTVHVDVTNPTFDSTNLGDNDNTLNNTNKITLTFSEEITYTSGITLKQNATDLDISTSKTGKTITITINSSLEMFKDYTLAIPKESIKDSLGNQLSEDKTFTFNYNDGTMLFISTDGNGNGLSWKDAYSADKIQTAIDEMADKKGTIWIAKGTYKPTKTIEIKNHVKLYGGFAGNETKLSQRTNILKENNTTISGNDKIRVLRSENIKDTNTTLDGFIITKGKVTGYEDGGGMSNIDSKITIKNVIFSENKVNWHGGGMHNYNSSPKLANVTFSGNEANRSGGGIHNYNSSPTLTNVAFYKNKGLYGGGMHNSSSSPTLTNVTFSENTANQGGGGMINYGESSSTLINVTFSKNKASFGGGINNNGNNSPTFINVTFSENKATGSRGGGGTYNEDSSSPKLINTIFWGNDGDDGKKDIGNSSSTPTLSYSITEQTSNLGTATDHVTHTNPNLTKKTKVVNGVTHTYYELQKSSSALNAGFNNANSATTDQIGNTRIANTIIDIGAIEMKEQAPYEMSSNLNGSVLTSNEINITFSEPMVMQGGDITLNGENANTTLSDDNKTLTIKLDSGNFEKEKEYKLTIPTTAIQGKDGSTFTNDIKYNFIYNDGTMLFVSKDGNESNNGLSWKNAYSADKIQTAIDEMADKKGTIWIAKGTYKPTQTIEIKNHVKLYGGFAGTETSLSQRDLTKTENNTTLSGNNERRVLKSQDIDDNKTTLDGFIVTEGKVDSDIGAGMYNDNSNITIKNVTFKENIAGNNGGGMHNVNSSPTLTNVAFYKNKGLYGGGMHNSSSSPTLTNVTFSENTANQGGGGMINYGESSSTLINVTFSKNKAGFGGGINNNGNNSPKLINVTFSENKTTDSFGGGGVYNESSSSPTLINTIFWGNDGGSGNKDIENEDASNTSTLSYSITEQTSNLGTATDHVTHTNPNLTKKTKVVNGVTHTYYTFDTSSSAYNKGKDGANDKSTDQIGNPRKIGVIDIGAYEFTPTVINPLKSRFEDANLASNKKVYIDGDKLTIQFNVNIESISDDKIMLDSSAVDSSSVTKSGNDLTISGFTNGTEYTLTIKKDLNATAKLSEDYTITFTATTQRFEKTNIGVTGASPNDGSVIDYKTGRIWQDNAGSKTTNINWTNAIKHCEDLTLGGYEDWYLPSIDELVSIVDAGNFPTIYNQFKYTIPNHYWSSTTYAPKPSFALYVNFNSSSDGREGKSNSIYVRCVRAGH